MTESILTTESLAEINQSLAAKKPADHIFRKAPMIKPNRKFVTMDATRGIAAICVMLFHYLGGAGIPLFSSGYVAVDFFFCLSGFIIAFSYGDKLASNKMAPSEFLVIRAIRLYPMYLVGTIMGVFCYFASNDFGVGQVGMRRALIAIPFALLCLPFLFRVPITLGRDIVDDLVFPFNVPSWSLFFEVIVNVLYAIVRWSKQGVYIVFAVACLYFVMTTVKDGPSGFLIVNFAGGLPRSTFSFLTGVLIFYLWERGLLPGVRVNPIIPCSCVMVLCLLPYSNTTFLLSVFIAVPFTVAASIQNPAAAGISKMFILLGEISYPTYAIHVPIYQLSQFAWNRVFGLPLTNAMPWPALLIVAAAVICIAFMFVRWWDGPIRRRAMAELVTVKTRRYPATS
jgi:peptidoglycan/LPS O-acetylase OafA/YrhL